MPADFSTHQGGTDTFITGLVDASNTPIDLTGATVALLLRSLTSLAPVQLANMAEVMTPATLGGVQYTFAASDTVTAGNYMANWVVTYAGGQVATYPNPGYMWVEIEPSLTGEPQQLVSLPDIKEYLGLDPAQRNRDHELLTMIEGMRPQIEDITGPIIPIKRQEWHDGGQTFIELDRPPNTGMGTTPVLTLLGCSEWRGPIEYPLLVIQDPAHGSIYSCMLDPYDGTVTRHTAGGAVTPFPPQEQCVRATYQSGQAVVPANVRQACLEIVRVNLRTTESLGKGMQAEMEQLDQRRVFTIPPGAERMLKPTSRAPSII